MKRGPQSKYSRETVAAIRAFAEQRLSMAQAAAKTGLTKKQLEHIASTNGIRFRSNRIPVARLETIRALSAQGLTQAQIAQRLGYSEASVQRATKIYSIPTGPRKTAGKNLSRPPQTREEADALRLVLRLAITAQRYGLSSLDAVDSAMKAARMAG